MRRIFFCVVLIGVLSFAPGTIQAANITDGVLGIPWGASPTQARQLMEQNNYTFLTEAVQPGSGLPIFQYKGMYATYTARVYLKFMLKQMVELDVALFESENNMGVSYIFKDIDRLLTEKYGPWTRDTSRILSVEKLKVPYTTHQWDDVGGAGLEISLTLDPGWSVPGTTWEARVRVAYNNNGLYEKLKAQSRQNI